MHLATRYKKGIYLAFNKAIVKDVVPKEGKSFSKIFDKEKKELWLSDYVALETKKLYAFTKSGWIVNIQGIIGSFHFKMAFVRSYETSWIFTRSA